jgi:hypothetical protein
MDILGIDQSLTTTGLARRLNGGITTTRVRTEHDDDESLLATRARIRFILHEVLAFAPEAGLYVIEAPAINSIGGKKLERVGLYWLLVDALLLRGPVVAVGPSTRAVYAADNGRASKKEVVASMRAKLPDLNIPDDNVADAAALLAMGARFVGSPIDGEPTIKQTKAMGVPAWPNLEGATR